jgi:hypothetical protein
MATTHEWIHVFSDGQRQELIEAAATSAAAHVSLIALDQETFQLPTLGPVLKRLQDQVINGRGFVLLRGLPIAGLSRAHIARMYLGLGAWFGEPVAQNAQGHILGHVKDLGNDPEDPAIRVYTTTHRHLFHTDSCDMVGLLCLQPAKRGGESAIASSTSIYNEIVRQRPDLAKVLTQPFIVDRKGEIPEGKAPTYQIPIFHRHNGQITAIYARDFIAAAQARFPDLPRLTHAQVEAMDLIDQLAASDEFRLDMDFRPGDIQILHNHQIFHARSRYEDYPEPQRKRHLLRLWLSAPNGRTLPQVFAERYGEIAVGRRRGGITVPGQMLTVPLEAE